MAVPKLTRPAGIAAVGTYVPASRLRREAISTALGTSAGRGARSVASHDEDTTSLAVEAARRAWTPGSDIHPTSVLFSTTRPAYADKTNATTVHAALGLGQDVAAYDMVGSVRSGAGALRLALEGARLGRSALAVSSDIRTGLPSSADESGGGDGAVALLVADQDLIVELEAMASTTTEFLDRWRLPEESRSHTWEERFGETVYLELLESAIDDVWKQSGLTASDVDHLVVTGLHERAVRRAPRALGVREGVENTTFSQLVGNTGCAQSGLSFADALDRAAPDELILSVCLADGVDIFLWRATDLIRTYQAENSSLRSRVEAGTIDIDYASFLTWRGSLDREPPRRPEPDRTSAPPAFRSEGWKFAFCGSRCVTCETRHLPPGRVCSSCGAIDSMTAQPMAGVPGTVATFTIDRLAYSLSPPVVVAVIDFDGGGRIQCEMTDVAPEDVAVGNRVEMSFRRLSTVDAVHNYFWKARPLRKTDGEGEGV